YVAPYATFGVDLVDYTVSDYNIEKAAVIEFLNIDPINTGATQLWRDAFTDTDYTDIGSHSPDTGTGGYTTNVGGIGVDSNKLKATSFGSGVVGFYSAQTMFDS